MASKFKNNIKSTQRKINTKVNEAMNQVVNDLTRKAKQLAPLDTGDLRGSGEGEVSEQNGNVVGTVSFNKPYALRQHEDMSFRHPRGGQAKYLEQPLNENIDKYKEFIQKKIKETTE